MRLGLLLFILCSMVAAPLYAEDAPKESTPKKDEPPKNPIEEARKLAAAVKKEEESAMKKREAAAKGETKEKKPKKEKPDPADVEEKAVEGQFVKLPKFRVPVVQDRELKTYYLVELAIECDNAEAAHKVYRNRPRLIDALIVDLYSVFGLLWNPDFHADLEELKKRLAKVCSKVLGTDLFDKVLVQNFTITLK